MHLKTQLLGRQRVNNLTGVVTYLFLGFIVGVAYVSIQMLAILRENNVILINETLGSGYSSYIRDNSLLTLIFNSGPIGTVVGTVMIIAIIAGILIFLEKLYFALIDSC